MDNVAKIIEKIKESSTDNMKEIELSPKIDLRRVESILEEYSDVMERLK